MRKSWFHSILHKQELDYSCNLSNSPDSLGPLQNTSEDPILKERNKKGSSSESYIDSSNVDAIKEKEETDAVKDKEEAEKLWSFFDITDAVKNKKKETDAVKDKEEAEKLLSDIMKALDKRLDNPNKFIQDSNDSNQNSDSINLTELNNLDERLDSDSINLTDLNNLDALLDSYSINLTDMKNLYKLLNSEFIYLNEMKRLYMDRFFDSDYVTLKNLKNLYQILSSDEVTLNDLNNLDQIRDMDCVNLNDLNKSDKEERFQTDDGPPTKSSFALIRKPRKPIILERPNYSDPNYTAQFAHLWILCDNCDTLNYKQHSKEKMFICEECEEHLPVSSSDRIEQLIDPGTWKPMDENMGTVDPLEVSFFPEEFANVMGFDYSQTKYDYYSKERSDSEDSCERKYPYFESEKEDLSDSEDSCERKYPYFESEKEDLSDSEDSCERKYPYFESEKEDLSDSEDSCERKYPYFESEKEDLSDSEDSCERKYSVNSEKGSNSDDKSDSEEGSNSEDKSDSEEGSNSEDKSDFEERSDFEEGSNSEAGSNSEDKSSDSEERSDSEEGSNSEAGSNSENKSDSDEGSDSEEETYPEYLYSYQKRTGVADAVQTGIGELKGIPIALAVMVSDFVAGSMGSVVGEKITRLIEYATNNSLPLIIVCASGGARMQEGGWSLMQMAKISCALYYYHLKKKSVYISIITSPTTGGVTASFATLGDIIIAEPNAYIAFAGKRVIEQLLNVEVPEGSQETENLFDKGMFDIMVPRTILKDVISELFELHGILSDQEAQKQ